MRVTPRDGLKDKGIHYTADHLRRMEAKGQFPKSFQLGPGRVVYDEAEVDEWLEQRKRASRAVAGAAGNVTAA